MSDKKSIRPSYYNRGGIEAVDVVKAWGLNFNTGNALKYIARAGHKPGGETKTVEGGALEDLRKARTYIDFEIQEREAHLEELKDNPPYEPPTITSRSMTSEDRKATVAFPIERVMSKPLILEPEALPESSEERAPPPSPLLVKQLAALPTMVPTKPPTHELSWLCARCGESKTSGECYRTHDDDPDEPSSRYCAQCASLIRKGL